MTPPDPSGPDGPYPRLAGFTDNELDDTQRRHVQEWVESDPGAAEVLRDQEALAPASAEFWAAVEPAPPSDVAWEAARRRIADRLSSGSLALRVTADSRSESATPGGRKALFATAAGVAFAAAAGWVYLARPGVPADRPGPAAAVAVAPMPREVVADDPMPDRLPLAAAGDVVVVGVPAASLTPQPGDRPMLFAVGLRNP